VGDGSRLSRGGAGRAFVKMSGSGNDFLFFDVRQEPAGGLDQPERIRALCARGTGVGADGVVFVEGSSRADFAIRYFNADGSLASLCGNASLCSTRLAAELGVAAASGMTFETGAGTLAARLRDSDGQPEIDLEPLRGLQPDVAGIALGKGERRVGYAVAGVPHLVVLCDDVSAADVAGRGPGLRAHPSIGPAGANVNWISPDPASRSQEGGAWRIRTFERGVEGETLACGTGAVAAAAVLAAWGLAPAIGTKLVTRSGRTLAARFRKDERGGGDRPSLAGEGRIVFVGELGEI
jgi:diaminopimelate epimerase